MSRNSYGLSATDLRTIAKSLEQWNRLLVTKDGLYQPRAELVKRIEVNRPEIDDEPIGYFEFEDGWVSFVPRGWTL